MYKNNPNYTLKLIDLIDFNKLDFDYEEIYDKISDWLGSEKKFFYTQDDLKWNEFIQLLCDTFYDRELNFDTYLDFKINFRACLKKYKDRAERLVKCEFDKINPLNTYLHKSHSNTDTSHTVNREGNSTNTTDGENHDTSHNDGNSTNKDFNLHSDTPSNSVNVDDLFKSNSNYITDASNNQGSNENHNTVKSDGNFTNSGTSTNTSTENGTNRNIYDDFSNGYDGNALELFEKFEHITTNVNNLYIKWIENEHLFSSILY